MRSDFSLQTPLRNGCAYLPHMSDFVEPPPKPRQQDTRRFMGFFNSGWPTTTSGMADPTSVANANPDPPTPADRVVPVHDWRTKKDPKGEKRAKGKGRWVVVSLGFHRVRCLGDGST